MRLGGYACGRGRSIRPLRRFVAWAGAAYAANSNRCIAERYMRPWRRCALLLITGLCTAAARPAAAHPHVFIDNTVTFVFTGDKITGLRLLWTFDEVFSETLLEDFDTDRDGSFSAAEIAKIKKTSLPSLKQFDYFVHLWVDGKPFKSFDATDLMVTHKGDSVSYDMQITLATPLDPRQGKLEAAIFDD